MDHQWIEERVRAIRLEIARLIKEGEDEEGLCLRSLLAELERWESLRREIMQATQSPRLSHRP